MPDFILTNLKGSYYFDRKFREIGNYSSVNYSLTKVEEINYYGS
jgi:hypothetical protein